MAAPAPAARLVGGKRPVGSGHLEADLLARARPTSRSQDQLLPVLPVLAPLLPGGGLQRGTVVSVGAVVGTGAGISPTADGTTTLAFALLAAATDTGSWCAAVGTADPGVVAIAELGVDLERLALVPHPGPRWAEVAAALLDGMDVVVVQPPGPVRPGVARRLAARARERRSVLITLVKGLGRWPEGPDVGLVVESGSWWGVDEGHGYLQGRRVELCGTGRRAAVRPVRVAMWLPSSTGALAPAGDGDTQR